MQANVQYFPADMDELWRLGTWLGNFLVIGEMYLGCISPSETGDSAETRRRCHPQQCRTARMNSTPIPSELTDKVQLLIKYDSPINRYILGDRGNVFRVYQSV